MADLGRGMGGLILSNLQVLMFKAHIIAGEVVPH